MRQSATVFTCCLFMAAFLPLAAHAVTLQAWIEGQTKSATSLAGTYPTIDDGSKSYTVSAGATLVGPDSVQDYIRFHNIVISSTTHDAVTGHIYFWGDYDPGPIGTVTFKLSANGTITRKVGAITKAATSSTFSASGWVQHPIDASRPGDGASGSWSHITYPYNPSPPAYTLNVVCDSVATCGTINHITPPPGYQQAGVNTPRIMKGEIWFYLHKKNDKLNLNINSGVLVQTSGGGGSGGPTNGGEGTGEPTCPQCCCCAPCKGEPPPDLFPPKLPIDKFIYKQVPLPILKEYLFEREKEEAGMMK